MNTADNSSSLQLPLGPLSPGSPMGSVSYGATSVESQAESSVGTPPPKGSMEPVDGFNKNKPVWTDAVLNKMEELHRVEVERTRDALARRGEKEDEIDPLVELDYKTIQDMSVKMGEEGRVNEGDLGSNWYTQYCTKKVLESLKSSFKKDQLEQLWKGYVANWPKSYEKQNVLFRVDEKKLADAPTIDCICCFGLGSLSEMITAGPWSGKEHARRFKQHLTVVDLALKIYEVNIANGYDEKMKLYFADYLYTKGDKALLEGLFKTDNGFIKANNNITVEVRDSAALIRDEMKLSTLVISLAADIPLREVLADRFKIDGGFNSLAGIICKSAGHVSGKDVNTDRVKKMLDHFPEKSVSYEEAGNPDGASYAQEVLHLRKRFQ